MDVQLHDTGCRPQVTAPRISVIIVNYNGKDDLRRCLAALRESTLPAEVIVVDNASRDGSAEMVRSESPEVKLLEPGANLYFCAGNNYGVKAATGDYALLLNPDTVPPPDALATLVHVMDNHPDYAGPTRQLRYPNGDIQRTCSRIPGYRYLLLTQTVLQFLFRGARKKAEDHHWYFDEGWDRTSDFDVEAIPGSCTLMRRQELQLSDHLLLYFNEDDLARRFAGRKFRFLAAPAIEHREKSVTRSATATRIYFRDLIAYCKQHHGWIRAGVIWLLSRPLEWAIRWRMRRQAS